MKRSKECYRIVNIDGEVKKFTYYKSKIPKGFRKFREIYIPSLEYKKLLQSYIPYLSNLLKENDQLKVNHAFLNDKNCITNANEHIGYLYCLSFDIKNFFDNIKKDHLSWLVDTKILDLFLIDGSPKQGLPTSPILSNIAFLKIDSEIYTEIVSPYDIVYTRYADDLYFSFNDLNLRKIITRRIKNIVNKYSFELNERKYSFQKRKNGNIVITGISVTENGVKPTRKTLRNLRAAKHRLEKFEHKYQNSENNERISKQQQKVNGLISWSECKLPKNFRKNNRSKKCQ